MDIPWYPHWYGVKVYITIILFIKQHNFPWTNPIEILLLNTTINTPIDMISILNHIPIRFPF